MNKHAVLLKAQINHQGGLEKQMRCIASAFADRGIFVSILTTQVPYEKMEGINYCTIPESFGPKFWKIEQFDRSVQCWLAKYPADIIFGMDRNRIQTHLRAGNGIHAAYLQHRLLSEGKCKYLACQLNPLHRKILALENDAFTCPKLRKIFVNSHMVQKELLLHYPVDPKKVQVIYNGVEWNAWQIHCSITNIEKNALFKTFSLDPDQLQLLFVGHGFKRKGLDILLDALSMWNYKNFHLSIIGKDKSISAYQYKAKHLGLQKHVHFFGFQNNVIPFYQMADVLIIPSFYDPFANVTIEALAMGLFVISSKTNGGHEILLPQTGTIIENLFSPDAILSALDQALNHKKSPKSITRIRSTVAHLDFTHQLKTLLDACE